MPESKHHRKNRSHSEWRKTRNIRRAQEQGRKAQERRGMRQAMRMMTQQVETQEKAPFERVENATTEYYENENQVGEK